MFAPLRFIRAILLHPSSHPPVPSENAPGSSHQTVQAEPLVPVKCKLSASFARDFTEQCLAIVLDYRESQRSKADAVESLVRAVMSERDRGTGDRPRDLDQAFPVYLDMLDEFDREKIAATQAGVVGRQGVGSEKGVADPPRKGGSSKVRGRDEDTEQDQSRKRHAIDDLIPIGDGDHRDLPRDLGRTLDLV